MNVFDTNGNPLTESPDLTKGWLEEKMTFVKSHDGVPDTVHYELVPGSEQVRTEVIDKRGVPAWDEYNVSYVYHPYTPEELQKRLHRDYQRRLDSVDTAILDLSLGGIDNV